MRRQISIKAARVASDMTQERLAERLGVSRQTVSNWETGKNGMRSEHLLSFCGLTGFKAEEIFLPTNNA